MGAFDYTTNGVKCMLILAWLPGELESGQWSMVLSGDKGGPGELTHNTPKHLQTCHKIVPYKTVYI